MAISKRERYARAVNTSLAARWLTPILAVTAVGIGGLDLIDDGSVSYEYLQSVLPAGIVATLISYLVFRHNEKIISERK